MNEPLSGMYKNEVCTSEFSASFLFIDRAQLKAVGVYNSRFREETECDLRVDRDHLQTTLRRNCSLRI